MNADGSAAVTADVSAGAEVPVLSTVIAALFITAALLLLIGAVLIAVPIRSASQGASTDLANQGGHHGDVPGDEPGNER